MPIPKTLSSTLVLFGACLAAAVSFGASAAPKTVCTITVNSPDEKETFRRYLPPGEYNFVELVERGRPDWLASACQQRVQCDSLIISGHFDGGTEFYTDRLDTSEYLSVEEMERASCSDSCPGVFSQLKEVYLFGCNTLKPEPRQTASEEIVRALVRSGQSPSDAARLAAQLGERHAESNRDRMRHIFKDVPVIYGFSSKAPLGRYAGPLLDRYFQTAPAGEIGGGQVSPKLLSLFAPSSMTVTTGLTAAESQAGLARRLHSWTTGSRTRRRSPSCELLQRDVTEVRCSGAPGSASRRRSGRAPGAPKTAAAFAASPATAPRESLPHVCADTDQPAADRMMALGTNIGG
jgi:hypothetical protein